MCMSNWVLISMENWASKFVVCNEKNDEEHTWRYIEALIQDVESDKKAVLLYVLFEAGTIVFMLREFDSELILLRLVFIFAIVSLLISLWLFFKYFRALHKARLRLTNCLYSLDANEAQSIIKSPLAGVWMFHGKKLLYAKKLLVIGILLCVASVAMGNLLPWMQNWLFTEPCG